MFIYKDYTTRNGCPFTVKSWLDVSVKDVVGLGYKEFEFYLQPLSPVFRKAHRIELRYENTQFGLNDYLGGFNFTRMPGCHGVLIAHNTSITPGWRGRGWGTELHRIQEEIARKAKYSMLVCTTRVDNHRENLILNKLEWKIDRIFLNQVTNNKCYLWSKPLCEEPNEMGI